ncbi:unnamed protein product [Effrenium voratum]|uniref:Uncharacterized protein n=1 Tax=Effrenium voratum TaxID=2562239 RepID=A0AA36J7W1_9DINO|nr:unnamed protein product [Effrenium voratum]
MVDGSPGKTRFVTADLGGTTCVKALQGHSSATGVSVQELYPRADHEHFTETYGPNNVPDLMLAHGTFGRHVESIRSGGLLPGGGTTDRQTTHFALTTRGAFLYPLNLMRRSADVVLVASLEAILRSGITLYCGAEGVYLTDQAVDPGQLSAWSVLTGGRQGDLLFGSADRGLIVRPDRQESIQRLGPLNRSFSQSSQGGLTGPGVKQYLSALAAYSARYQGKAPAARAQRGLLLEQSMMCLPFPRPWLSSGRNKSVSGREPLELRLRDPRRREHQKLRPRSSAAVPEEDDEIAPPPLPAPAEPPTGYVSLDDEESVEIEAEEQEPIKESVRASGTGESCGETEGHSAMEETGRTKMMTFGHILSRPARAAEDQQVNMFGAPRGGIESPRGPKLWKSLLQAAVGTAANVAEGTSKHG